MKQTNQHDLEIEMDGYDRRRLTIQQQILDAAAELVRKSGAVDVSVRDIALRAGVSPATPFNHFGSKEGIFSAIIKRSVADLYKNHPKSTDNKRLIQKLFVDMSQFYVDDETLFRPLLSVVLPGTLEENGALRLAIQSIQQTLEHLADVNEIEKWANLEILAEQLEAYWIGTAVLWARGSVTSQDWLNRVDHGISLILASSRVDESALTMKRELMRKQKKVKPLI